MSLTPQPQPPSEGLHDASPTPPPQAHHAGPPSSTSTPEPTGAAQFIANLNDRQKAHLQFAIPSTNEPERLSQFLEGPRQTPVPTRFAFAALGSEVRKQKEIESSSKSTKSSVYSRHVRDDSGTSASDGDSHTHRKGAHSATGRATSSIGTLKRASTMFSKEAGSLRGSAANLKTTVIDAVDWSFHATGLSLVLVNLIIAWDVTAVSIALPTIAFTLHGSAVESFWLGIAFFAGAATFLPLISAFSEIFGRKPMLLTAMGIYALGSFICAVSGKFTGLHLGRTVQGIGAGGAFVLSDLITSDLISSLDKRRWSAASGAMWAIGAVTGPAVGEALSEKSEWRWIFWINLPFVVTAFIILAVFASLKDRAPGSILAQLQDYDWIGFGLLTASVVSLLVGISWGGTRYKWSHPNTLLPIQFGFLGLGIYLVWSWYSPFRSIVSLDGFMDRTIFATYIGHMVQGAIISCVVYLMPFYFTVAKLDLSYLAPGVRWLPWTLPCVTLILLTYVIVSRWNCWLFSIWTGWGLVLLGLALTTLYTRHSSVATWVCVAIILGSGIGVLSPSLHTASELIASQGDEDISRRAVTNYAFFHILGKSFGVAIGSSIFGNELLKRFEKIPTVNEYARNYAKDAVALVARIRATPGGEGSARMRITDAYVDALRVIWVVLSVFAGLALLISVLGKPRISRRRREVEMKDLGKEGYVV